MYKTFFGLQQNPFNINTDPRFLFPTKATREALDRLTYGIEARKGFLLLTGEVGTGKTTLLNTLLESLHHQNVATAFVFNPRLSASQLFEYMIADFGIPCKSRLRSHLLFRLNQWLLDRYQAGEHTVLVVDEAQMLSYQTLEEIRLLTNLETSTEKLLQIVLAGQPEFEEKLNQRELRQLRQRIALRAKTMPLTREETCGYIVERLQVAGGHGDMIFDPTAMEAVFQHARGIPRVTNLLCDQALMRAFVEQRKPVSAEIIEAVARDFSLDEVDTTPEPPPSQGPGTRRARRRRPSRVRRAPAERVAPPSQPAPFPVNQIELPLFVYGYGPDGSPFYEQALTIATNERGGLISLSSPVQLGQRLIITNKENECSQECVVEFLGARLARGVDVAFEFASPMPQFWRPRETEEDAMRKAQEACA
jgi:general secretion pathway protein A